LKEGRNFLSTNDNNRDVNESRVGIHKTDGLGDLPYQISRDKSNGIMIGKSQNKNSQPSLGGVYGQQSLTPNKEFAAQLRKEDRHLSQPSILQASGDPWVAESDKRGSR